MTNAQTELLNLVNASENGSITFTASNTWEYNGQTINRNTLRSLENAGEVIATYKSNGTGKYMDVTIRSTVSGWTAC